MGTCLLGKLLCSVRADTEGAGVGRGPRARTHGGRAPHSRAQGHNGEGWGRAGFALLSVALSAHKESRPRGVRKEQCLTGAS